MLLQAINDAFIKTFGPEAARAFMYHVDPEICVCNPEAYEKTIKNVFGPGGGKMVIDKIIERLCELSEMDKMEWPGLGDFMKDFMIHYQGSGS